MLQRIGFGVAAGSIATFALLLLMQSLIESDQSPFSEFAVANIVDFVRVEEEVEVRSKRPPPIKPPKVVEPPPDMPEWAFDESNLGIGIEIGPPQTDPVTPTAHNGGFVDGEYLPIVKVSPNYPSRAASRGIEGYVLLEFTVSSAGAVRDPKVVEASPAGIFDRAAKEAALKFRYKPRVVNGTPIDVPGVLNRITFNLRND